MSAKTFVLGRSLGGLAERVLFSIRGGHEEFFGVPRPVRLSSSISLRHRGGCYRWGYESKHVRWLRANPVRTPFPHVETKGSRKPTRRERKAAHLAAQRMQERP